MSDRPVTLQELKLTACVYAAHGAARHLASHGRLPDRIGGPWSVIPMRHIIEERGTNPDLTPDEQSILDAMLRENLGQTRKLAAQNGIPELTALYQAQREMRRVEAEKNEANAEVQANLSASNAQIQSLMSAARDGSASWEYRRSVLGRATTGCSRSIPSAGSWCCR